MGDDVQDAVEPEPEHSVRRDGAAPTVHARFQEREERRDAAGCRGRQAAVCQSVQRRHPRRHGDLRPVQSVCKCADPRDD